MDQATQSTSEDAGVTPVAGALARKRVRRFSAVEFLVVLAFWIVSASFLIQVRGGDLIEAVLATVVLFSAVLAVGGRRKTLGVAVVLGAPTFVCKWISHLRPDLMPREVYSTGLIVFMVFIVAHHLRFVLRAPRVNSEVLCAGISIYLMLGILWACAYILVAEFSPGSFAFTVAADSHRSMEAFQALYFSLGTLSGFAYGDIVPLSNAARMLATVEATIGMFYVAVLIARLVSLYSAGQPAREEGGKGAP